MIEFTGVSKRFGRLMALDNITVKIPSGTITGLIGFNGSGKSTLLKIAAGIESPSAGQVTLDGVTVGQLTRSKTAYVPEKNALYKWMSVQEVLDFQESFFTDFSREKAQAMLDFMGLTGRQKVGSLSKGMQARLKLVIALSRKAPVYLLDEPLSGIDPLSRSKIIDAIVERFHTPEQTIILSTHEVAETEKLFDRIIFLNGGQVALEGEADELRWEYGCSIQELFGKVVQ